MSSKLKAKSSKKTLYPMNYSNQELQLRAQGMNYDLNLIREKLKEAYEKGLAEGIEKAGKEGFEIGYKKGYNAGIDKGFDDGCEYANIISTICNSVALNQRFKFGVQRLIDVFEKSNEVTREINKDKKNIWKHIEFLKKRSFCFDDESIEFLKRII